MTDTKQPPVQVEVTQKPAAPVPVIEGGSQAQPSQTETPPDQALKTSTSAAPVALAGVPDTPPSAAPLGVGPAVPSEDYVSRAGDPNVETSALGSELVGADAAAANGLPVTPVPQAAPKPADGV